MTEKGRGRPPPPKRVANSKPRPAAQLGWLSRVIGSLKWLAAAGLLGGLAHFVMWPKARNSRDRSKLRLKRALRTPANSKLIEPVTGQRLA